MHTCRRRAGFKKIAKLTGDKKAEMISVKELQSVTGYIRGGCSPVGMKKHYPTWIEESAKQYSEIVVSAGVRGQQIVLPAEKLATFINGKFVSIMAD